MPKCASMLLEGLLHERDEVVDHGSLDGDRRDQSDLLSPRPHRTSHENLYRHRSLTLRTLTTVPLTSRRSILQLDRKRCLRWRGGVC